MHIGYWEKYNNGILKCRGKISLAANTSNSLIYFPQTFVDSPFVFIQNICYYTNVNWSVGVNPGTGSFYVYPRTSTGNAVPDFQCYAYYEATGHWQI